MEKEKMLNEIPGDALKAVNGGYAGSWGRFYCDPCDESRFCESNLEMNMAGGWVYTHEHSSIAGDPGLVR